MIYNAILNDYGNVCDSFTIYIGLFVIAFLITIDISIYLCFSLVYKKSNTCVITNIDANTEAAVY